MVGFPIKESIIGDKSYKISKTLFTAPRGGVDAGKSESKYLSTKLMSFLWNLDFVELDLRA